MKTKEKAKIDVVTILEKCKKLNKKGINRWPIWHVKNWVKNPFFWYNVSDFFKQMNYLKLISTIIYSNFQAYNLIKP